MLGKKLINSGPISSGANTFASENFNTVIYTGNGSNQRIGGYINKGAIFNGSNSFISLPQNTDFDLNGNGSFSIWVKRNNTSRVWIIDKANGGSGSYGWQLYFHNGQYGFQMHDTSNNIITVSSGTSGIATNAWEHIVITSNTSRVYKMYVNGTLKNTQTLSAAVSVNTNGVTLGKYSLASGYEVNGTMDQLRFFNKELSQSEITTLYGETFASTTISTTDIFDDNSGVALYQLDGNANDTGGVTGRLTGDAAIFNGSTSLLTMNQATVLGNIFGVTFWINIPSTPPDNDWIFQFSYGQNVGLYIDSNGVLQVYIGSYSANESYATSQTFSTNTWYNVVLTCDGSTTTTYVNGVSKGTGLLRGGQNTSYNYQNVIGGYQTSGSASNHTSMRMEDFRIYNRHITATEASNLYNDTAISSTNLANRYIMKTNFNDSVGTRNLTNNNVLLNYSGTPSNITYQEATNFSPDLVWIKSRSTTKGHIISDSVTNDGTSNSLPFLSSHLTDRQYTGSEAGGNYIRNLNSNGFTVGGSLFTGSNGTNFVAWCFNAGDGNAVNNTDGSVASTVKANTAAGFSIVKFNGASGASTCGHGLSQAPELFIMKSLNVSGTWGVYVKNLGANKYLTLNDSVAQATSTTAWNNTHPTSTLLHWQGGIVAGGAGYTNVAYCFHSVTGYQKIGSYTGTGAAGNIVETGFEPAFLMIKIATANDSWFMVDNKRETTNPRGDRLFANSSAAEASEPGAQVNFLANGFEITGSGGGMGQTNSSGATYVYIAIAADPDQTDPTVENSFSNILWSGTGSARSITGLGFKPDLVWWKARNASNYNWKAIDSINGPTKNLYNNLTNSLATDVATTSFDDDGFTFGSGGNGNVSGLNYAGYAWKAGDHDDSIPQINTEGNIQSVVSVNDAAGFSILKYTGNEQASQTVGHGLSSSPEIAIVKQLDGGRDWTVLLFTQTSGDYMHLNSSQAESTDTNKWSAVSSTTFTVGADPYTNGAGSPYIAYLWYSVAGHSKIGYYSGNGYSGNQITGLGFSPKFLMIKRTDSAGGWRVQDTSRLGSSGTQKNVLEVNDVAAEQSNYVDISFDTNGFTLNTTAGDYNASGTNNYLYMAFK